MRRLLPLVARLLLAGLIATQGAEAKSAESASFVNSLGMKMVRIEPGSFKMGQERGAGWERVKPLDRPSAESWLDSTTHTDWDEIPVHTVHITKPFYLSATEVTNAQYEQFAPEHKALRGKRGFSSGDDEAVIFVSWHEAVAFCQWLSKKEGKPYRLPTEAEWEYACRAGTTTPFWTGDALPKEIIEKQALRYSQEYDTNVSLRVGQFAPNPWGLFDMHGNVEEWCWDWYGPYEAAEQSDPVGRAAGLF
ncbi:MAG: formylglycine-generating enzyme family protein, partial [Candidatus Sumerlaeia bacterium]|nr:formylglycine-generating enzyme family protein [Candidatus Sumerlaeia bacterium]